MLSSPGLDRVRSSRPLIGSQIRTPPPSRLAASRLPSREKAMTSEPFRLLPASSGVGVYRSAPVLTRHVAMVATTAINVCPSVAVWLCR